MGDVKTFEKGVIMPNLFLAISVRVFPKRFS
jgi:hypothetical protein